MYDKPICGKSCAGKYGKQIQPGKQQKLDTSYIDNRIYYKLDK